MPSASPRVAVVGCGVIGQRRAQVVRATGIGTVAAVADLDAARAADAAAAFGCAAADWHDAVRRDDVDIVIVATPHNWLAPIAIEALAGGKHVLVEKPMARTPAEARAILAAAGRGGSPVVKVGFNHRHHPAVQRAYALVRRGEIGEPCFVRCRYGHGGRPGYASEWRADRERAGGGSSSTRGSTPSI